MCEGYAHYLKVYFLCVLTVYNEFVAYNVNHCKAYDRVIQFFPLFIYNMGEKVPSLKPKKYFELIFFISERPVLYFLYRTHI
jgi:hypothetical protein